ncbi:MAG: isochorismatase family protein [Pseudoxanthomonas sp.]
MDRSTLNAWEDPAFLAAVKATGRRKLVMMALWTEVCLTFPALSALRDGDEVFPVVDAVGGTSLEAHRAGLQRIVQAGAHPVSWVQWTVSCSATGTGKPRCRRSPRSCLRWKETEHNSAFTDHRAMETGKAPRIPNEDSCKDMR